MKIIVLMENTASDKRFECEHGLSFYVETAAHKILVDLGPDDKFIHNAQKLGFDIKSVDTVVISHGHDDHGGGLEAFLNLNQRADIYVQKNTFDNFYFKFQDDKEYIGLNNSLKMGSQIRFADSFTVIDEGLTIISGITGRELTSSANLTLFKEADSQLVPDDFSHEQCLVLKENDKYILMGGCAHNGIINILNYFREQMGFDPDVVISGFHLFNPTLQKAESEELIDAIAEKLCKLNTKFYTCHCTGLAPYQKLKIRLGQQIEYLSAGMSIEL